MMLRSLISRLFRMAHKLDIDENLPPFLSTQCQCVSPLQGVSLGLYVNTLGPVALSKSVSLLAFFCVSFR